MRLVTFCGCTNSKQGSTMRSSDVKFLQLCVAMITSLTIIVCILQLYAFKTSEPRAHGHSGAVTVYRASRYDCQATCASMGA